MKANRNIGKKVVAIITSFVIIYIGSLALLSHAGNKRLMSAVAEAASVETVEQGNLQYSDGSTYSGDVLYGRVRNGTGTFSWSTGESYSGEWINDVIDGHGKMEWPGLGVYEGSFANGKRNGQGEFIWTYKGTPEQGSPLSFEGEWVNDKIGKRGKLTFAGLGVYNGQFSNQGRSGEGVFLWDNGDIYEGAWANDAITGAGKLSLADGSVLEGQFAKGVLNRGTITYEVNGGKAVRNVQGGRIQADVKIEYNDGTTVKGKLAKKEFTGNVTINYKNGDTYVGSMKNGWKNGKGTYTWSSGAHYVGEWSNDKMSGTGKYYYGKSENSYYLSGSFSDGSPSGILIYIGENNRLRYETIWINGTCTSIKYKK